MYTLRMGYKIKTPTADAWREVKRNEFKWNVCSFRCFSLIFNKKKSETDDDNNDAHVSLRFSTLQLHAHKETQRPHNGSAPNTDTHTHSQPREACSMVFSFSRRLHTNVCVCVCVSAFNIVTIALKRRRLPLWHPFPPLPCSPPILLWQPFWFLPFASLAVPPFFFVSFFLSSLSPFPF